MPTIDQLKGYIGQQLLDDDGDKIGKIADLYVDDDTNEPKWFAVTSGLFGKKVSFVPIAESSPSGDDVRVPYSKDHVKDAPSVEADGQLEPDDERQLFRHYDLDHSDAGGQQGKTGQERRSDERRDAGEGGAATKDKSSKDRGDAVRERSGGDVTAGSGKVPSTEETSAGVRLRKYVVTEEKTITVPVQREVVEVEEEPGDEER